MPVYNWFKVTSGGRGRSQRDRSSIQHTSMIRGWQTAYYSQEGGSIVCDSSQSYGHCLYVTNNDLYPNDPHHGSTGDLNQNYQGAPRASPSTQTVAPILRQSHQPIHRGSTTSTALCDWRIGYGLPSTFGNGASAQRGSFDPLYNTFILPQIISSSHRQPRDMRRTPYEEEQEYLARMTLAPRIHCIPLPPLQD